MKIFSENMMSKKLKKRKKKKANLQLHEYINSEELTISTW